MIFVGGWTLYCKCTNFQANHNFFIGWYFFYFVGLYIANVLTFKRITTMTAFGKADNGWTLYCKCTNFQANHNYNYIHRYRGSVGLYIANVLTFKRITTQYNSTIVLLVLDSILQMY